MHHEQQHTKIKQTNHYATNTTILKKKTAISTHTHTHRAPAAQSHMDEAQTNKQNKTTIELTSFSRIQIHRQ